MPMNIQCDHCLCTWQMEFHPGIGKVVYCPACGHPVQIPLPQQSSSSLPPAFISSESLEPSESSPLADPLTNSDERTPSASSDSESSEFHLAEDVKSTPQITLPKGASGGKTSESSTAMGTGSPSTNEGKRTPRQVVDTSDFSVNLSAKSPSIPIPSLSKVSKSSSSNAENGQALTEDHQWETFLLQDMDGQKQGLAEDAHTPSVAKFPKESEATANNVRPNRSPETERKRASPTIPTIMFGQNTTPKAVEIPPPTTTSPPRLPPQLPNSATETPTTFSPRVTGQNTTLPPIVPVGVTSTLTDAKSTRSVPPVVPKEHEHAVGANVPQLGPTQRKENPNLSFLSANTVGTSAAKSSSKPDLATLSDVMKPEASPSTPSASILSNKRGRFSRFFRKFDPVVLGAGTLVGLFVLIVLAYFIVPLCLPKKVAVVENVESQPAVSVAKPSRDTKREELEKVFTDAELTLPKDWLTNVRCYPEDHSDLQQLIDELPENGILVISKGTQITKPFVIRKPMRLVGNGNTFDTSILQGKDETTSLITVEMPLKRSAKELVERPSPSSDCITFQNLTISSNSKTALHVVEGELRLVNCFVRQQSDAAHSVAVCCDTQSFVSMDKCQFESGGEAIYLKSSIGSNVNNCTIVGASCGVWFGSSKPQTATTATIRQLKISNVNLGVEFLGSPNGKVESVEIHEPRSAGMVVRTQDRDPADVDPDASSLSVPELVVQDSKMVLNEPDSRGVVCHSGNIDLRNVTLECGETRYGVEIRGGQALKFENLEVRGSKVGVFCGGRAGAQFTKCRFLESLTAGALVQCAATKYTDSVTQFRGCTFRDSRGTGVHLENGPVEFVDCTLEANLNAGVLVTDGRETTVSRCQFLAQKGDAPGLLVAAEKQNAEPNASVCEVIGSTFYNLKNHGIEVREGTVHVRQCTFTGGKTVGIMVCQNGAGVFEDCTVQEHTLAGVQVQDGGSPRFMRCQFIQNQTNGALIVKDRGAVCLFQTCRFDSNKLTGVEVRDSGGDWNDMLPTEAKPTENTEPSPQSAVYPSGTASETAESETAAPSAPTAPTPPKDATTPPKDVTSETLSQIPSQGTLFLDCHIDRNEQSGVLCTGVGSRPEFRSCFMEGNQRAGVVACEEANVLVRSCTLTGNEFGIWVYKKGGGSVRECKFEQIRRHLYVIEKNAGILSRYKNQPSDE